MKSTIIKCTAFLLLLSAISFSEVDLDTFTTINAFTSASIFQSLKIHESKVWKNRAEISWEDHYPMDSKVRAFFFRFGKASGVYIDTLHLTDFVAKQPQILPVENLESGTKYFAQFYTDYNASLDSLNFVFTTPPLDPIAPVGVKQPYVSSRFSTHQKISSVEITTMNGKRMFKYAVPSVSSAQKALSASHLATGLYIIYYKDVNNKILSSDKLLVN